jgi:LysM repeat protein
MGGCFSGASFSSQESPQNNDVALQQVQTRLDDSHHGLHCMQADFQILESRIKQLESSLANVKNLARQLQTLENRQQEIVKDIKQLSSHANETSTTFSQYKNHLGELEKEISSQHQKLNEVHQLKSSLESVAESIKQISSADVTYRVLPGDSLERIARKYRVSLDALRRANGLDQDRIMVGQELKIPAHP